MGVIIFNGKSSFDYHIQVEHPPGYEAAERDFDVTHVPGRNGDIIMDKGSYKNVNRTYEIAVTDSYNRFSNMANGVLEWLSSAKSYARLEDSYEPEYYRQAVYKGPLEIENILQHAGRATISFNCKPQRFLKSGEQITRFTNQGKIYNPTGFHALPLITVKGSGVGILRIGAYIVGLTFKDPSITIDSEMQDAYYKTINRNSSVKLNEGFPQLVPGENKISYTNGITAVEVIPRWWTL